MNLNDVFVSPAFIGLICSISSSLHSNILEILFKIFELVFFKYSLSNSLNSSKESNSLIMFLLYLLMRKSNSDMNLMYKSSHKPSFTACFLYSSLRIEENLLLNSRSKYTCPSITQELHPPTFASIILSFLSKLIQYSSVSPSSYTDE